MLAEVIVDVRSFRFDDPLTYAVPGKLQRRVRAGCVVRVPLRGRRVRGWIVELKEKEDAPPASAAPAGEVLPIAGVSGRGPLFDGPLLAALQAAARRSVAPVSSFLNLLTPARLGRYDPREFPGSSAAVGRPPPQVVWRLAAGEDPHERYVDMIESSLGRGRGAIVLVPEVREGSLVLDRLSSRFDRQVALVHSGQDPALRSEALWSVASGDRKVVLGSRAAVFVPAFPLGVIILHSEHDRSFKEQRAPYYDAREVALARAALVSAAVCFTSATPSLETLAKADEARDAHRGWEFVEPERPAERGAWPAVEVIEPSKTTMARRAIAAIIEARRRGERAIVVLPRTSSTPTGPGPTRVAEFLRRVVPEATITRADRPALTEPGSLAEALEGDVIVATEAALAEIERPPVSTAIALDVDVLLNRPRGGAVEDAFRTLWTLGGLVAGRNPRGRLVLETRAASHHVIQALTRGDYHYFAERELESRRQTQSPPFTSLVRLRSREFGEAIIQMLRDLEGTEVLGPAPGVRGMEVLLKVRDLDKVLDPLREVAGSSDARMLVEVDPRDW